MHPPLAALLWLLFAPPLMLLGGRIGLAVAALAALAALVAGPLLVSAQAIVLGATATLALAFLTRPGQREHWGALIWSGWATLPLWSPAHPVFWQLWPGAVFADAAWDPARGALLYEKWGAAMALPAVSFLPVWLAWLAAALAARALAVRMAPESNPGSPA